MQTSTEQPAWPPGESEMAARIREFDWATTPLGPLASWPQSLKTPVELVLATRQPMYLLWGPALTILYGDAIVATFGSKHPGALGRPWVEVWAEMAPDYQPVLDAVLRGEARYLEDAPALIAGQRRWFTFSVTPVRDEAENVAGILTVTIDTTEKVLGEQALRESEERLRLVADNIPVQIGFYDRELRYAYVNEGGARFFGVKRGEMVGKTLREWLKPHVFARLRPYFDAALRGEYVRIEDREPDKFGPGRDGWTEETYVPQRGPDGRVTGFVALVVDISKHKWAEDALRAGEARFRTLVQNLPDFAIFMLDPAGVITEWTEGAERVTGYVATDAIGQHVSLVYTPEEIAAGIVEGELAEAAATGRSEREGWRVRKDGARFWADEIVTAIRDGAGALLGFTKISRDLTERRRAQEALRESQERLRAIVAEATDYAIFTADAEGRIDSWFPGAEAVFGWRAAEALGQPIDMTYTPDDRQAGAPQKECETARRTGVAADIRWHQRRDGRRVFIEGTVRARHGAEGEFAGVLKIGRDATERRLQEQRQREEEARIREELARQVADATAELRALSRRLLAVQEDERRRLALELHDEIGQVLTGLGLQLATANRADSDRLEEARRTVGELTEQVRQLSMDLRPAVLDAYGLLPALHWHLERYQQRTGVTVELRTEGLGRRFAAPVEIATFRLVQEALTNVARHAETARAVVQLFADDAVLTVSVRDEGQGFAVDATPAGSGLGGMRERVELLGGTLVIDAAPDAGVVITAELPLGEPPGEDEP